LSANAGHRRRLGQTVLQLADPAPTERWGDDVAVEHVFRAVAFFRLAVEHMLTASRAFDSA
jgi:hypothetical protein